MFEFLYLSVSILYENLSIIFYYSTQIGVPGGKTGNMFINVPIEVTCYQPETVGRMLIFIHICHFFLIPYIIQNIFST